MRDVRSLAAAYGVRVEITGLGDWGSANLIAEYDPDGPVIRVNEHALPHRSSGDVRALRQAQDDLVGRAIAHELYHHREAIGEIPRIAERAARERAADAYAESLLASVGSGAPDSR